MWDATKQERLDALRHREQESALTDEQRHTLEQLLHELEQEEWRRLSPALERLRQEHVRLQQQCSGGRIQTAVLAAIAERQADLLARAKAQVTGLLNEQAILESELDRALNQPSSDTR